MKIVPIFFAFDERMLMPAGVCITSLLVNADKDTFYDIFVLHNKDCDFSTSLLTRLPDVYKNCRISFRTINEEFAGAYEIRGITISTYYKLLAPIAIPEYDKILYSDVDVIFREDLSKYYEIEIGDNYFAAVDNCSVLRPEVQKSLESRLNIDWRDGYYYAGNLIVNSRQLKQDNKVEEFLRLAHFNFYQQDMDIMNIACNKRIYPLGPSFCITVPLYDLIIDRYEDMREIYGEEELEHALKSGIVHYNGAKPWNSICYNMDIWWYYYRQSVFFEEGFVHRFWDDHRQLLDNLSLSKRLKLVLNYFRKRFPFRR